MSFSQSVQNSGAVAQGRWSLQPGCAISMVPKKAVVLRPCQGRLWVTLGRSGGGTPSDSGDLFLVPGNALVVPAGARAVVEAEATPDGGACVCFDASDRVLPAGRFASEVGMPGRELAAALTRVGAALAKVGHGLLRWVGPSTFGPKQSLEPLDCRRL